MADVCRGTVHKHTTTSELENERVRETSDVVLYIPYEQ